MADRGVKRYVVAAALTAAWFGSQRAFGDRSAGARWISDVGLGLLPIAVAGLCLRRAHRHHESRRAWGLLALSALSWGLGECTWTFYESALNQDVPFPSFADVGYLLSVPLLVAGLLSLPNTPTVWSGRMRLLLDGCLVAISLSMVSWHLVLAPTVQAGADTTLEQVIGLAYPVGDVVCASVALIALSRARHGSKVPTQVLLLLVAGSLFNAVADSGFAFLTLRGTYYSGHVIDLFWWLGYLALGLAALVPAGLDAPEREGAGRRDLTLVGPYAAVFVGVLADMAKVIKDHELGTFLTWGTIVLVQVLVLRQLLAIRENSVLTSSLEKRVEQRTRRLAEREAWFRTLAQNLSDVVTVIDPGGRITYQTPSAEAHFGRTPADSLRRVVSDWWTSFDAVRLTALLDELARHPGSTRVFSGEVLHADGHAIPVEATVTSVADDDHLTGFVVTARDVTERRRLERELSHQAFHDSLTGLANRALFRDRVEHALETRSRLAAPLAVLFLDLDGFKHINDTFGHGVGDQLLTAVADRLQLCVRPGDTVARFGGDEFAVLLETLVGDTGAAEVAGRIGQALKETVELAGRGVTVSASCGIALYNGDESAEDLIRNADLAMYRAKNRGGADFEVFEPGMHAALVERLDLESDLRLALVRKELRLHYQPVVSLEDQRWVGTEALIRWESATRGMVPPMAFIGVAEDIGMISEIGTWVLREACRQTALWRREVPELADLTVAVNVSPSQLTPDFLAVVDAALGDAGLPAAALTVELTENILIERTDDMLFLLHALRSRGVRLAIDDFGTGYSSLSYLSRFPVDILKIDRAFVSRLAAGSEEEELTHTIVRLSQSLSLMTVAEGIEEQSQLDSLRLMGCELGQGYLFSKPITPEALLASVEARRAAH